jgi:hypothetical protein
MLINNTRSGTKSPILANGGDPHVSPYILAGILLRYVAVRIVQALGVLTVNPTRD